MKATAVLFAIGWAVVVLVLGVGSLASDASSKSSSQGTAQTSCRQPQRFPFSRYGWVDADRLARERAERNDALPVCRPPGWTSPILWGSLLVATATAVGAYFVMSECGRRREPR
ncbi:hypothetical protein [Mycobacterium sp. 1274756.6]|uniref:hypothetical protein n=1 Tax=Mycobacterium sp. 1274756.6 TaxID=1834076 RepID=UPI0007FDA478|nr:hypothetical protein [Mycobacterium sp. 1274756.6]OBJ72310.1 hypothetical protein A5643_05785 [Mycobacterium sp. 1274756.6]